MQIGSFSLIKELNTSVILKTIRNSKSISRAEISKRTGLTPATVTNITSSLLLNKIITETKLGKSNGGRKPVLLAFNYSQYNVCGVVISKHKIIVTLTDLEANLIKQNIIRISSDIDSSEAISYIIDNIKDVFRISKKKVLGIGVSIEGLVDEKKGICVFSNNFDWENINFKEIFENEFKIPVFVNNDVKSLTLGEKFFGSAKNSNDFILLYIGYGIGACLVNNGKLYTGSSNYASEIGHTTLDINGPLCSCGNKGCFQALASGSALLRDIKLKGYDKKYFLNEDLTVEKIIDKSNAGNKDIREIIKMHSHYIGVGLANIVNIFNPSLIIVNGFLCHTDDIMKSEVISQVKKRSLKNMQKNLNIIFSKMGSDEIYKGAIALFISHFFENPDRFFEEINNE